MKQDKRFTDAEIAAEYWCSSWREVSPETSSGVKIESTRRASILHRFATTPSYDEAVAA